ASGFWSWGCCSRCRLPTSRRSRRVVDPRKIETVGRSERAAARAVARIEGGAEVARAPLALPHELQRPHHGAHLMVQEAARARGDDDEIELARDVEPVERLDRRLGLAFGGAEGGEVVLAENELSGFVHRGSVEVHGNVPDAAPVEGRPGPAVEDAVLVVAGGGGKTRLERVGHLLGAQ